MLGAVAPRKDPTKWILKQSQSPLIYGSPIYLLQLGEVIVLPIELDLDSCSR